MIRLIACDIDGTLLQAGQETLPPAIHPLIRQLEERGVAFCVASGRQFSNLHALFGPSAGRIYYVCENGALVFGKGAPDRPLKKIVLTRELIRALAADIQDRPECEILFSGLNTSYLLLRDPASLEKIRPYLGSRIISVESAGQIEDEIVQISAFCQPDTQAPYAALSARWAERVNVTVAGEHWIDFSTASKGAGVELLCGELGITPRQVMAFGDNFNDVSMLDLVGCPVIMENAPEALRTRYGVRCRDVVESLRTALAAGKL